MNTLTPQDRSVLTHRLAKVPNIRTSTQPELDVNARGSPLIHLRPRKNVREETAGFIQSLDILLNDACEVANNDESLINENASAAVTAPNLMPPTVGSSVVRTCMHASSSASPGTKRISCEVFDHDAVADYLSHGAWNDLLPKNDDGSDSIALDDFTLHTAAATLGLGPIPSVSTESSHSISTARGHMAHNGAVTNSSTHMPVPAVGQAPVDARKGVPTQHLDDESADSDAASIATNGASADQPSSPTPPSPVSTPNPGMQNSIECSILHPSLSSSLPVAADSRSWTVLDAASNELKLVNSSSSRSRHSDSNEDAKNKAPSTGFSSYQDCADAHGNSAGASSDCIALAITGVFA